MFIVVLLPAPPRLHAVFRVLSAEICHCEFGVHVELRERVVFDQSCFVKFLFGKLFSIGGPCEVSNHQWDVSSGVDEQYAFAVDCIEFGVVVSQQKPIALVTVEVIVR